MFSKSILRVEVLSLELCQKTERWAESALAKNVEDQYQLLVRERQEIMDCGMRLMQVRVLSLLP